MPTLCRPAVAYPSHTVTCEDTLRFLAAQFADRPWLERALDMVRNTTVDERHLCAKLTSLPELGGMAQRSKCYGEAARLLSEDVARQALDHAGLQANAISLVVVASCTGYLMPSLTAYLGNRLGLPRDVIQLPVAQMGCAAGAWGLNRSVDHCRLSPRHNALLVCVETSSLCFQPAHSNLEDLVSDGLFGDAAAAAVIRGDDAVGGFRVQATASDLLPQSEHYICYGILDSGFHFQLDKVVMTAIRQVAPELSRFVVEHTGDIARALDFCILHTGGRRIMDEVERYLELPGDRLRHSRSCLAQTGNTSSVAVLDVAARHWDERVSGERGLLAAFGPGFSTEMALGTWA